MLIWKRALLLCKWRESSTPMQRTSWCNRENPYKGRESLQRQTEPKFSHNKTYKGDYQRLLVWRRRWLLGLPWYKQSVPWIRYCLYPAQPEMWIRAERSYLLSWATRHLWKKWKKKHQLQNHKQPVHNHNRNHSSSASWSNKSLCIQFSVSCYQLLNLKAASRLNQLQAKQRSGNKQTSRCHLSYNGGQAAF